LYLLGENDGIQSEKVEMVNEIKAETFIAEGAKSFLSNKFKSAENTYLVSGNGLPWYTMRPSQLKGVKGEYWRKKVVYKTACQRMGERSRVPKRKKRTPSMN